MFEARLVQGNLLKKLLESVKDLVSEANFECTSSSFAMQVRRAERASVDRLRQRRSLPAMRAGACRPRSAPKFCYTKPLLFIRRPRPAAAA